MKDIPEEPWNLCEPSPCEGVKKQFYPFEGIWRLVSMENMDTILKAVGINPMTLEMVMKADAMITIYEDIDHQWKILQETSIIAKSLRGYRTRNFKMTANKFKLDVPKPEVVDDWDLRYIVTTVELDLEGGEGNERLILHQIAEKDMKHKLDTKTVFTGQDDMMTMTITAFHEGQKIVGTKKYIRHQIHESKVPSGTVSPNGIIPNGRPNSLLKKSKEVNNRKLSAPF